MADEINQEVRSFLETSFLIDFNELDLDTDLFRAGIVDSFGFVELVNFLEKKFPIKIDDQDLTSDALTSLTNIVDCIHHKLASAQTH